MTNDDLYTLTAPFPSNTLAGWAPHLLPFDTVIGHSALGHVFVRCSTGGEYAVVHPFRRSLKKYGRYDSIAFFQREVLDSASFRDKVLCAELVGAVRALVGPLQDGQVYIPCPYPTLGGSCAPETYDKGDFFVFMELVGQTHGL